MTIHKKILTALVATVFLAALVFFVTDAPRTVDAGSAQNVNGWGWSSNIGYISFNNVSSGDATNY